MQRRTFVHLGLSAPLAASSYLARANDWPAKPVKLLLSQPPGSGADTIARSIGEFLARSWSQPVVVENRPGGQNVIGAQAAARSPADGYSFYFATAAALVSNTYLFKTLPYDPRKDFQPVGLVARVPFALLVPAASPFRSVADLVASAKAQPGKVSLANEGPKTFGGILSRLFSARLGIELNQIAYASVGAAVTETVGGQTDALLCDMPSSLAMVQAGRLRALAVSTGQRARGWDQVPPLADTVVGFDFAGWLAIVAPTGTPDVAVQRFARDLDAALRDKDISARIQSIGPTPESGGTVDSFRSFLQAEHGRWAPLARDIGLLPE
jgi:tripartite-type tricarboxylate transporter receptor subunit TctC